MINHEAILVIVKQYNYPRVVGRFIKSVSFNYF
jgi:hypothetical protein